MKFFLCVLSAFLSLTKIFSYELCDFEKEGVIYQWDRQEEYDQALGVYLKAFDALYAQLGIEDRAEHFQATMKHEKELAEKNHENIHWLVAKKEGDFVGLAVLEFDHFPDIYIRELAVVPEMQRKGIGRTLNFAVLRDYPEIRKILIVTRRINEVAQGFYTSLGFESSNFCHAEYDPSRYVGMEWANSFVAQVD